LGGRPDERMTSIADTLTALREALALEAEATARYAGHQARTADPRLFAFWEGLRRNESGHHTELLETIVHLESRVRDIAPAPKPEAGR
jgi:rubrerythrin